MEKYYKKPNGMVIKYDPTRHNEKSMKERFEECNADGSKPKPKAKKEKE
jgi:hypothetical protein|tara:strand:- start:340 stop:486 length:147 start_codon:yes stop_codon:yes gene_type:complete